jgi:ferredoxin/flavodoxin---NADP+ reductase
MIKHVENEILEHEQLSDVIHSYIVYCPDLARACKAGQFVVVRIDEVGERVPLTIADFDRERGTITLVVQTLGASTLRMAEMKVGRAHV